MAQQNINTGTAAGANDGDSVYEAFVKTQANFDELYTDITGVSNGKIFNQPIDLTGVDFNTYTTELSRIARAIVIKNPGFTVPFGHLGVVSHYRSYNDEQSNETLYYVDYYGITTGPGNYGTITNPSYTDYTPGPGNIIKLGSLVSAPASEIELGDIGSSTIQAAINSASPSVTKSGFTVVTATISGVVRQYVFDADDGLYGSADGSTGADNFIDAAAQDKASIDASTENKKPVVSATDLTLSSDSFERTIIMTGNTGTITTPDDATLNFSIGIRGKAIFTGTGPHVFAYNSGGATGASSTFTVLQDEVIEFEKIADNDWIVYVVGKSEEDEEVKSYGSYGMESNATATDLTGVGSGIYTKVLGTTTVADLQDFTHTDNRLTYTGTQTKLFTLLASVSMTSATNNTVVSMKVAKNGTVVGFPTRRKVSSGADVGASAVLWSGDLDTGDYVELWVTDDDVSSAITVTDLSVTVKE